jgi:hypothetical protein
MRVLLTAATGFQGRNVVVDLLERGFVSRLSFVTGEELNRCLDSPKSTALTVIFLKF